MEIEPVKRTRSSVRPKPDLNILSRRTESKYGKGGIHPAVLPCDPAPAKTIQGNALRAPRENPEIDEI